MADIEQMKGTWKITSMDGERAVLGGSAPVVTMKNYHKDVVATRGYGRLFAALRDMNHAITAKRL